MVHSYFLQNNVILQFKTPITTLQESTHPLSLVYTTHTTYVQDYQSYSQ